MKMWTSPKLIELHNDLVGAGDVSGWWLCCHWLRRRFGWPQSAKFFWITLGSRPSVNRAAVEFKQFGTPDDPFHRGREKGQRAWQGMYPDFPCALVQHFGPRLTSGPLYLGLLYEE